MKNRQPYYHSAKVLFTATRDIPQAEFEKALQRALSKVRLKGLLKDSIQVEEIDSEPGDPADLL